MWARLLECREQERHARCNLRPKMDVRANLGLTWIDHSKDFGFKK